MTLKDESPSLEGVQYATWEEWRTTTNSSRKKMKWLGQSENKAPLRMCLVVEVKSDAVKNNIA